MEPLGPSWTDADYGAVATYLDSGTSHWAGDACQFFFVRRQWIEQFLNQNSLALVVISKFERFMMDGDKTWNHPHSVGWSGILLEQDGSLRQVGKDHISLNPYSKR
jgi:hypothetical protein